MSKYIPVTGPLPRPVTTPVQFYLEDRISTIDLKAKLRENGERVYTVATIRTRKDGKIELYLPPGLPTEVFHTDQDDIIWPAT